MGESQARDFALGALASRSLRVFGAPNEENKGRQGGCYPSEYRRQGGCQQHPLRPSNARICAFAHCALRAAERQTLGGGGGCGADLGCSARRGMVLAATAALWAFLYAVSCALALGASAAASARTRALTQPHTPSNDQHAPSPTAVARGRCEAAALTPRRGVNSPRSGLSPSRPLLQRGWRAPRRPPRGARWARGRCWWSPTRTTRPCSSRRC